MRLIDLSLRLANMARASSGVRRWWRGVLVSFAVAAAYFLLDRRWDSVDGEIALVASARKQAEELRLRALNTPAGADRYRLLSVAADFERAAAQLRQDVSRKVGELRAHETALETARGWRATCS